MVWGPSNFECQHTFYGLPSWFAGPCNTKTAIFGQAGVFFFFFFFFVWTLKEKIDDHGIVTHGEYSTPMIVNVVLFDNISVQGSIQIICKH